MNPALFNSSAPTGMMPADEVEALQKALTAGYGTDVSTLTGGGALRIQSLDHVLQATIVENKHFRLFNALAKMKAGATVDEWTEQSDIGGFLGGSTNSETGTILNATGVYARRVGMVKYLMTQRQVSLVQTMQNAIIESEAVEYAAGAKQLLQDAEFLSFEGDSTVVPTEFDGIYAQMVHGIAAGQVNPGNVIDLQASPLSSITPINSAAAQIAGFGNFGTPTDLYMSQLVQADFDSGLDPAFRVALDNAPNSIMLGTPVTGIRTTYGNIATNVDVFVRDGQQMTPFELRYPSVSASQAALAPVSVTLGTAGNAGSMFAAGTAGNYYYRVAGLNAQGTSTTILSAQQAVAAGQGCTLTITRSAGAQETGYVIYRSRLNGTSATADMREMCRIPCAGATSTYVDLNTDIPGCSKAYMLNMTKGDTAITWRQLMPMIKFQLYPTQSAVNPWAQLMFGYLRISKRNQHVAFKNVLPRAAAWRPFNV